MNPDWFDTLRTQLATAVTRRHALAGLGALALGGSSMLAVSRATAAEVSAEDRLHPCVERCVDRSDNHDHRRSERCRRRCQDR